MPARRPPTQAEPSRPGPGRQGRTSCGALHLVALALARSTRFGSAATGWQPAGMRKADELGAASTQSGQRSNLSTNPETFIHGLGVVKDLVKAMLEGFVTSCPHAVHKVIPRFGLMRPQVVPRHVHIGR